MTVRKVELVNNKPETLPAKSDLDLLKIDILSRFYLAKDNYGSVYKLHRAIHPDVEKGRSRKFIWIALWNSTSWTGINGVNNWETLEDAIECALKNDWQVIQLNLPDLKNIMSFFGD